MATEAGVTTGSLYHHFGSKDELVRALLEQGYSQILEEVRDAIHGLGEEAEPTRVLAAGLKAHLQCLLAPDSLPAANVRIHAHVPVHLRSATVGGRRDYEDYWINLLREFAETGHVRSDILPRSLVMILFGSMNWSLEWFRTDRDSFGDFADDLLRLIRA